MEDEQNGLSERLGRAVRVIRTGQDLSRKELAQRCGLSYSYLAEIESGTKMPSSRALASLAEALGMAAHELLEAAERWEHSPPPHSFTELREQLSLGDIEQLGSGAAYERLRRASPGGTRGLGSASSRRGLLESLHTLTRLRGRARRSAGPDAPDLEEIVDTLTRDAGGAAAATELLELLAGMTPEDRERLLDLARRLVEE